METIKEDNPVENKVVSESTIQQNSENQKRMNYSKVIVFAFTGDTFSFKFMQCWMEMFNFCIDNGIKPLMSFSGEKDPHVLRNLLLGGNMNHGFDQKPFQGKLNYDYIVFIDPSVLFTINHLKTLLFHIESHDIVSAIHPTPDMKYFNAIENTDVSEIREHGTFRYISREKVEEMSKSENPLLKVDYVDFHFTMFKKGIFEVMEYPWFRGSICNVIKDKQVYSDNYSPTHSMCNLIKSKGFNIMIDTTLKVSMEIKVIL